MGDERLRNIVGQLELVRGRKMMFIGSSSSLAMSAYLSGYHSAAQALGVLLPYENWQSAKEERGWLRSAEVWPVSEMRERGMADEAMADEMLAIDIAAWQRIIEMTQA